jgi:hypothetical protein
MLEQILGRIQQQKGQMPEEMQKGIGLIERWIENRIKELGEAGDAAAPAEGGAS